MTRLKLGIVWLVLLIAACEGVSVSTSTPTAQDRQVAPTLSPPQTPLVIAVPSPSPTVSNLEETLLPTITAPCTNELRFERDLTIPDGTIVASASLLDKRWLVSNTGSCNWDQQYRLSLVAGPGMGTSQEQALYPARSGTQAMVRMLLTAPAEPGTYRSAWQAISPQGDAFGDVIFLQVTVAVTTP